MSSNPGNQTYRPSDKDQKALDNNFVYHPPKDGQNTKYETIRSEAKTLAETLCFLCPPSRELSLALTNLEQVMFWANAAIARNE